MSPRRLIPAVALIVALVAPAHAGSQTGVSDPRAIDPSAPNPLVGSKWYVDEQNHAWGEWKRAERLGHKKDARTNRAIAVEPKFRWFGRSTRPNPEGKIRDYIQRAERRGEVPLMATLRHHGVRCSPTYTGGGPAEDARFRAWYRMLARAVGNHRVVIGYEPDSLGTIDCLKKSRRKARVATLRYGIDVLSQLPNATVYLEGGASDWESARRTASLLRQVGVAKVRGFMLNATHGDWTANNIRYGRELSRRTGGKHFIINTAYNGRGPVHYQKWTNAAHTHWRRVNLWCNAKKRGLGIAPTTTTNDPLVDAYMWINRPGISSGTCNGGVKRTTVGAWDQKRANMVVKYRTNWLRAPKGTRHGLRGKTPLREVAGTRAAGPVKRGY
jgi:endoglucanase